MTAPSIWPLGNLKVADALMSTILNVVALAPNATLPPENHCLLDAS